MQPSRDSNNAVAAIRSRRTDGLRAGLSECDASRRGRDSENRKDAVFWMAQVRIVESGSVIRDLMRNDDNADIRQHALFAYSQSGAADRIDALIDIVEDRDLPRDDRKNALFWLAQTESPQAIAYLEHLLVSN